MMEEANPIPPMTSIAVSMSKTPLSVIRYPFTVHRILTDNGEP